MSRRPNIVGTSPALKRALDQTARVAPTTASVVIRGESGTGKELFARVLHERSRRSGAFVAVNCAALPEAIAESVLFGHRRGAFTGANENQVGLVVGASGGTLFLDEVGELPLAVQAKLLRVLQERRVLAVGDTQERPVDLRVVTASHRDLRQLVADGRFREDLYYRLSAYELTLPPLRERGRDVVAIARHLLGLGQHGVAPRSLARNAEAVLVAHGWPGNVRELENVLFRASLGARGGTVTASDLRNALGAAATPAPDEPLAARVLALVSADGGASCADLAGALNVPRSTMQRLLKALVEAGDLRAVGVGKATRYARPTAGEVTDDRHRVALAIIARDGRVTRAGLAAEASLSTRTAGRVLAELVADGRLTPTGSGRVAGYVGSGEASSAA